MISSVLRRTLLVVWSFLLAAGSGAQTLTLDATTFYPDSNIIHTGLPVRWTGAMNWQNNRSVNYSVTYTFGDGQGYVVSRVTGNTNNGTDTFRAIHAYAASGVYTAKVVLKDALGAAVDSLIRPFNVGSGYIVTGKFYYDCTQNCQPDTAELGLGNSWIGIRINQTQRRYMTDSIGYYNVPVAAGDTLLRNTSVPDPGNTGITFFCPNPPIVTTNRAAHVPVWLKDEMYMSDLYMNPYACKGGQTLLFVKTHDIGGGKPRVKVDYRDGTVTSYSYASSNNHDFHYAYSTSGDYNVIVDLYNTNYAGPYMRFMKTIHVDSCKKIILKPVHDANKNCMADSGEVVPGITSLWVRSNYLGPYNWASYNGGKLEYLHYTGDTAMADTVLHLYTPTFGDTVHLRKSCPGLTITDSSPDSLDLPYGTHIRLTGIAAPFGTICYADTLQFTVTGQLVGYAPGTGFRLISIYGDGHSDSLSFNYSLDTFSLYPKHRYDTSGIRNCLFILQSGSGDVDTIRYQVTVNNCFPVFIRAFYDRNKNCSQDSGEAFATIFNVTTASRTHYSDQTSGVVKAIQYTSSDSVTGLTDHLLRLEQGYYTRAVTAAAGCHWPVMNVPGAQLLLPLVDTPSFITSYSGSPYRPCILTYSALLKVQVVANCGHSYTLIYYSGNGLYSDTFRLSAGYMKAFTIPVRTYDPGFYQPVYRVLDDSTGKVVGKGSLLWFAIEDTCGGSGQLFTDADGDCLFSFRDVPLAGQPVSIIWGSGTKTVLTDASGRFSTQLVSGNDSVRVPDPVGGNIKLSCGTGQTRLLKAGVQLAFPYACAGGTDLRLLAAHHYFKDSTADTLILYPSGYACNNGPGTLSISMPAGISYTGADMPGGVPGGSGVSWTIDTLRKLPSVIRIGLRCTPLPGTPVLCLSASLNGTAPDTDPGNNDFYLCDSVRTVIPEYYKSLSSDSMYADGVLLSGKELIYSLRIRNSSASDTIRSILMYDTLDARLDLSTVHMLDATFLNSAQLLAGRVLRIINYGTAMVLPGEEAAIRFGVMPQQGLAYGTVISNRISVVLGGVPEGESNIIYSLTAQPAAGVETAVPADGEVVVYPVPAPADGTFYIALSGKRPAAGKYELLDARGAICMTGMLDGQRTPVAAPGRAPGLYLVRVVTETGTYLLKMVITGAGQ